MPRRLTKAQKEAVEREALRLYDKYNPRPDRKINVGKADCINEARGKLYPRERK